MIIPLDFSPKKDRILVTCSVIMPPKNLPLLIKFVVDTGSAETFVDETDLLRFRIFAENYPHSDDMFMGGSKIALHNIGKSIINFRDSMNNLQSMNFSNLKVARTAWTRQSAVSSGTSILGMNFLLETKLHLFIDPANEIACLSDEK